MTSPSRKAIVPTESLWMSWLARVQGAAIGVAITATAPLALAQPAPPPVTVATPLSRPVTEWQEHMARVEPSARVDIRARVSGQVDQVHFTDGAIVRAGDPLFTLDQRPFRIALDTAQAEVARTEARLLLAEQQVARYEPLAASRIAPQAEIDSRRAALREAQAGLAAARAAERQAALDLEFTEIRAPRPGRVSDRRVDAGNLVQQGQTVLTTLLALDPVYVSFDPSEAEYLRQARSARAGLRGASLPVQLRLLDEAEFSREGRVDFVDSAFDARSGTIRVRAVVPNPDLFLTPGSFARIRLSTGEEPSLLVPDASVMADQTGRMVLTVAADGTVTPRQVRLGPLSDGLRVVRSGLAPEDRVIIGGLHRARPGMRVTAEQGRIGPSPLAAAD
ncbi:efflux RND transporter periplasmic adaptor subunit [Roseomonas sp. CECT 9278]|uniref:efflux RND transporter periplasmic adaptor subunit n=1 Tax=Roseomonas sp. CECT 9278 TaxID=2845823 RepID=UPI001E296573|nr:efflux RND transporter periplasmic adaptor subunit [Roseomonas sp. CECT 9278]CAH0299559.1 Efflux pump periplasmic linker BepF [Roseomonas sp. CECT 9278]